MNFSPFGGHFSTSIPTIHHFAAKFTHDNSGNALCPQETNSNRYTANGVPSFTQHHPPNHQQMSNTSKYQTGTYINQGTMYGQQSNIRQDKRQTYDQQDLAQELCAAMLQQTQQQQSEKQNNEKVCYIYHTFFIYYSLSILVGAYHVHFIFFLSLVCISLLVSLFTVPLNQLSMLIYYNICIGSILYIFHYFLLLFKKM